MTNSTPNKPKKSHTWRQQKISGIVDRWNREPSQIRNVNNVTVARNETLSCKETSKIDKKRGAF